MEAQGEHIYTCTRVFARVCLRQSITLIVAETSKVTE